MVLFGDDTLETGTIRFVPVNPGTSGGSGKVKDGHYSVELRAGKMLVQISSLKNVGKRKRDGAGDDVMEETIAAKYNTDTILEVDVVPGTQQVDFRLKAN